MLLATVGENHNDYRGCLQVIALAYLGLGEYKKSLSAFEKSATLASRAHGVYNINYVSISSNLLNVY